MLSTLRIASLLLLAILALATGCASMPEHVISVEARADSPAVLEALLILASSYVASDGTDPSGRATGAVTTEDNAFEGGAFFRSAGWRASINTPVVDIVGGMDRHWYPDQSVPETSIGLRKRFPGSEPGATYVEVLLRHGKNLDTISGEEDYDGLAIGIGGLAPLDEHWFVNICVVYETTLHTVQIDGDDDHLADFMLRFGIGYTF